MPLRVESSAAGREAWLGYGDNRAEAQRLVTALELGEGFQLLVVQVGDALAGAHLHVLVEEAARAVGEDEDEDGPVVLGSLALDRETRVSTLFELLGDTPRPRWFWLPAADSGEALENLFFLLNQKRDVLTKRADAPVVVAMHPLDWARFRRHAPDFWSIHQAVFRFSAAERELAMDAPVVLRSGAAVGSRPASGPVALAARVPAGAKRGPGERAEELAFGGGGQGAPQAPRGFASGQVSRGRSSGWRVDSFGDSRHRIELYGRAAELRSLTGALDEPGARVLVRGAPGTGKTSLIRRVLPQIEARYEGVWWVPLGELPASEDPLDLARQVLARLWSELAEGDPEGLDLLELYPRWFAATAERRLLFVFDDVESPELPPWLLPGGKSSAVMATARSATGGFRGFDQVLSLSGIGSEAGVEFLRSRGVHDESQARRLVQSFEGVPRSLSRVGALTSAGRAPLGPDPGETVSGLIADVVAVGSDGARELWPVLSLFATSFTTREAAAVACVEVGVAAQDLEELCSSGLVDMIEGGTLRWQLPPRSRELATQRLGAQPPAERRLHRLAFARLQLVSRPWTGSADGLASLVWLRGEVDDDGALPDDAWAVLRDVLGTWRATPPGVHPGNQAESEDIELVPVELSLFVAKAEDRREPKTGAANEAWAMGRGQLLALGDQGRLVEALAWVEGVLAAGPTGQALGAAQVIRAQLRRRSGDPPGESLEELEAAVARVDPEDRALAFGELGWAYRSVGRLQDARETFERSRALSAAQGRTQGESASLHALAKVALELGEVEQAQALLERSIDLQATPLGTAHSLEALTEVLRVRGDLDGARRSIERALELRAEELGAPDHRSMVEPLHELADILVAQGDSHRAAQVYERVLAVEAQAYGTRDRYPVAMTEVRLAGVLAGEAAGWERARALVAHAKPILEATRGPDSEWARSAKALAERLGEGDAPEG